MQTYHTKWLVKEELRTQSAPSNIRYLKRLDVGDIVRMQPIRTDGSESEREERETEREKGGCGEDSVLYALL